MLIILDGPGQMCNRMWSFAPLIAISKEYNRKLWILQFNEYKAYYQTETASSDLVKFCFFTTGFINKSILTILILLRKLFFKAKYVPFLNLFGIYYVNRLTEHAQCIKLLRTGKIVLIDSWSVLKDSDVMRKHSAFVKAVFSPATGFRQIVNDRFAFYKKDFDKVVGVHIRRGDYKQWKEGKYYFDDHVYIKALQELKQQMATSKVLFYICCNEKICESHYDDVSYYISSGAHPVEDLYALSQCDFILGPPSTFSMWASFYGNVPIFYHYGRDIGIELTRFSPITFQNFHQNGKAIWSN